MERMQVFFYSIVEIMRQLQFLKKELHTKRLHELMPELSDELMQWRVEDPRMISMIKELTR